MLFTGQSYLNFYTMNTSQKRMIIVESPSKIKTINKFLGSEYIVESSVGHIRDLPSKNGSVDPENKFEMQWEIDSFSKKYLKR